MGTEHKEYTWRLIAKRLNGEATPEELRELEDLLRSNPELHYPMQTVTDLWRSHNPQDQELAEQAFNRHLDRMKDLNIDFNPLPADPIEFQLYPIKSNSRKRSWLIAAAATVIVGLTFFWIHERRTDKSPAVLATAANVASENGDNDIFTGNGSRTHLVLPDGTAVWLNAGSRINYEKNFGVTDRIVNLTGEAFFDVAPNANKPFTIHTRRIDIRVLGTRFNVRSYPTDRTTETTLIGGSIEVSIKNRPSNKIILKPNEKLVIQNEDSISEETAKRHEPRSPESLVRISKPTYEQHSGAIIETSWVDNKLIFQDEPFVDLARRMERWYGVTIHFDGPRQEALHFTGNFEKETIQQALEALKLTANFNYTIEGNQITINER